MNVWEQRNKRALELIDRYGGIDGAHHLRWLIDQVVRSLTEHKYEAWVESHCNGDDGPQTYDWDTGVAP